MPIICVDIVIRDNNNRVLLLKRTQEPIIGQWWFPGGRIFKLEKIEDAMKRIMLKETGLEIGGYHRIGFEETIFNEDPFGHNCKTHTINFIYYCKANGQVHLDNTSNEYMWWTGEPDLEHWYLRKYVNSR